MKVMVEIDDITEPQKIALEDMFATMVMLGNIGSSRWFVFTPMVTGIIGQKY